MRKLCWSLLMMLLILMKVNGQDFKSDSLRAVIVNPPSDSVKVATLLTLGLHYQVDLLKNDSAFIIYQNALAIAREKKLQKLEIISLRRLARINSKNHGRDSSLVLLEEAFRKSRENNSADQEIAVLRTYISSESGFFIKDSFFTYYDKMLSISRENKLDSLGFMITFAQSATDMGNYPKALRVLFVILHANEAKKDSFAIENILYQIAHTYGETKDTKRAIEYFYKAKNYGDKDPFSNIFIHDDLSKAYLLQQQNDSAKHYADLAYKLALKFYGSEDKVYGGVLNDLGMIYDQLGKDSLAIDYLRRSYVYFTTVNVEYLNYCATTIGLARYFNKKGMADSSLMYARLCLGTALDKGFLPYISEASGLITGYFQKIHNTDSAYHYQQIGFEAYKTLYNDESGRQIQNMASAEQQREDDIAQAKKISDDQYAAKLRLYGMITIGIVAIVIGVIVYRNNRRKQKSYDLLKKQKQEIDLQKSKLESSIKDLQTTQSQLIQSEKMASLGELTAGIAHEIQNPLNFVNNFSEVNKEMLEELKAERLKPKAERDEQTEAEIIEDVIANEEKINHHGKRADAIVKGMLQHSRSSNGIKEATNINALADEYLRLAYQGLRAKDKTFNATLKTDFDETIGHINIIPQDIGRVILNLITNAFYAASLPSKGGFLDPDYKHQPTITVSTSKNPPSGGRGAEVLISVRDNGPGIPKKIVDKIFQPFFTTKPTGQGTGLGLSLSYDIVKAHGGEIRVETKEGEGSEFVIQLPVVRITG